MIMTNERKEQWVPLSRAAQEIGISKAKLSRMVTQGRVSSRSTPFDERVKLVDLEELKRMFKLSDEQ